MRAKKKEKRKKKKEKRKKRVLIIGQKIKIAKLFKMMNDSKTGVEKKTKTYRFRTHKDCFAGTEAVDWLIKNLRFSTREEGVAIGEALMHRGLLLHVLRSEPFQDSNFLYRFADVPDVRFTFTFNSFYSRARN